MSLKEYFTNMDHEEESEKRQESDQEAQALEEKKQKAIQALEALVRDFLPNLSPNLGPLVYNYDVHGGAFADFAAEGKKFLVYTELTANQAGSTSRMTLAVRESGKNRVLGSVPLPRKNAIFPEQAARDFEREISKLLRKEVGL